MKKRFIQNTNGIYLPTENRPLTVEQLIAQRACATISAGVVANCNTKPIAGTETTIWLMNRADVSGGLTFDGTNPLIVTGIAGTNIAYAFTGIKQSNTPSVKMNKGQFTNSWIHGLDFLIFSNNGATKKIIQDLSGSEIVAIVENKWKGTAGAFAFEMYGYGVGLTMTAGERSPNDAATGGAWKLSFGPNDGEFEDNVPYSIFDTDYATSKSIITALV